MSEMNIDIRHIAKLARLEIADDELSQFEEQMKNIVSTTDFSILLAPTNNTLSWKKRLIVRGISKFLGLFPIDIAEKGLMAKTIISNTVYKEIRRRMVFSVLVKLRFVKNIINIRRHTSMISMLAK